MVAGLEGGSPTPTSGSSMYSGVQNMALLLPIGYPMGRFGPVRRIPLADVVYEDYRDL
jgi:hypothetical protein